MRTVALLATAALLASCCWPVLAQDSLPPVEERTTDQDVVRFGDTVLKIAQRYGLTIQELPSLTPGLETGRLVVGSQLRLAQSARIAAPVTRPEFQAPDQSLAPLPPVMRPGTPEPRPEPVRRFDASLDALVREGVVTPGERMRVRGSLLSAQEAATRSKACRAGALPVQECNSVVTIIGRGSKAMVFIHNDGLSDGLDDGDLASLPTSADRVWVKVRRTVSIQELSSALDLDESRLARLNDVDEDHRFGNGDWLVVPSRLKERLGRIASLDSSIQRQSPPVSTSPPVENDGVVRFGDTVLKLAQRYGLSVAELVRLNPGLEIARLVVGSQVRLAQSAPGRTRMLLGLKPSTSGGISWPDIPDFGDPQPQFNGVSKPTSKPLSTNEQALLQRIRADSLSPQWRTYGQCKYNWAGWKLHSNGTRTTAAECGGFAMRWTVGVSCHHLLVATKTTASGWSKWAQPAGPDSKSRQGEDEMVAALCANASGLDGRR
jgi:LysM repeat protein